MSTYHPIIPLLPLTEQLTCSLCEWQGTYLETTKYHLIEPLPNGTRINTFAHCPACNTQLHVAVGDSIN